MKTRFALTMVATYAALAVWTVLASHLFVWIGGLSAYFPWPWTTWWRYARHPVIDGRTLAYLVISGILAALPFVLAGIVAWRLFRRGADKPALYGATDWTDKTKLRGDGLNTNRRPF